MEQGNTAITALVVLGVGGTLAFLLLHSKVQTAQQRVANPTPSGHTINPAGNRANPGNPYATINSQVKAGGAALAGAGTLISGLKNLWNQGAYAGNNYGPFGGSVTQPGGTTNLSGVSSVLHSNFVSSQLSSSPTSGQVSSGIAPTASYASMPSVNSTGSFVPVGSPTLANSVGSNNSSTAS